METSEFGAEKGSVTGPNKENRWLVSQTSNSGFQQSIFKGQVRRGIAEYMISSSDGEVMVVSEVNIINP